MPKYWGKQIFAHGIFPEVGQKQKTEKKKERKKEERKLVITMAKLRMAHAWRTQAAWANNCTESPASSEARLRLTSGIKTMLDDGLGVGDWY